MSATGTVSVYQPDGSAVPGFVRGFACRRDPDAQSHASVTPHVDDSEAPPEFRLTTVQPGVAVCIEVGALTRET